MSARPTRSTSSTARKTKELFRDVFALGKGKGWKFMHSGLFLDFLAGNQEYDCTPWGMPTRNIFGWQKPCYLLGEGYAKTFKELMETTDWDSYGTGKYEKCANCMAHCGYEPTAATAALDQPAEGALGGAARRQDRRARWRRRSICQAAPGAMRCEQVQKKLSRSVATAIAAQKPRSQASRAANHEQKGPNVGRARAKLRRWPQRSSLLVRTTAAAQRAQRAIEVDSRRDQRPQHRGIAHHAAHDGAHVDVAVRLDRDLRQFGQRAVGGIADHAQRGKGNAGAAA